MDPRKFEKKVVKLHKNIEKGKLDAAASGAAKLSGTDIPEQQRGALMSVQIKLLRLGKKEQAAKKLIDDQRVLVGKMAPYLTEALNMAHDGQFEDSVPKLKNALARSEIKDASPALMSLFPLAMNIVNVHRIYCKDEDAFMKATSRPSGFHGGEDREHVLTFSSLPEAYYYLDTKMCPRCGSHIKGARTGRDEGGQLWTMKCDNCNHTWKRLFNVRVPKPSQ
jgi:hypothetical protein